MMQAISVNKTRGRAGGRSEKDSSAAAVRAFPPRRANQLLTASPDACYGCVDWYIYPHRAVEEQSEEAERVGTGSPTSEREIAAPGGHA